MRDVELRVKEALGRIRGRVVDREFLSQELLDVVDKQRVSAFPWRGQFTPGLVGVLLDTYGQPNFRVLDPFAGSGTTLAESVRRQMVAVGTEVNPAALELSKIFTLSELEPEERNNFLARVRKRLIDLILGGEGSLFGASPDDLLADAIEIYKSCSSPYEANIVAVTIMLAMQDRRVLESGRLDRAFAQVEEVVNGLPARVVACSAQLADARQLPIEDGTIDLVLTSPPYINVFNYHQNYRPAIESLGWDVLAAAKTEIGSNRKHRQNRFLTVVQYAIDMTLAMQDFLRVCRPGAHVVIVVGRESRVRGVAFANGEIVGCIADLIPGFEFVRWQERSFTNRFGERIYEEVLAFRTSDAKSEETMPLELAAEIGRQLLVEGMSQPEADAVVSDMEAAVEGASQVKPSTDFAPLRRGDAADLLLPQRFSRRCPQPGYRSGRDQG